MNTVHDFERAWAKILRWKEQSIKLQTEKLQKELEEAKYRYDLREKFFQTGEIDAAVPKYIAESWKRCVQYGLDPSNCGFGKTIDENEFLHIREVNGDLIRIARPIMIMLHETLTPVTNLINLCDNKNNILEIVGNKEIVEDYATVNFKVGANWDEAIVGTNARSSCIIEDKPCIVRGEEMYAKLLADAGIAASPIHDHMGNIIGCLALDVDRENFNEFNLGIVKVTADFIEQQILLERNLRFMQETFNMLHDGILAIDRNNKISFINKKGCDILKISSRDVIGRDLHQIVSTPECSRLQPGIFHNLVLRLNGNSIRCVAQISPPAYIYENLNSVLTFQEEQKYANIVNKLSGNRAFYAFEDIITGDDGMKRSIRDAKKIALNNCNLLITGDSGTGKELFAHAIHNFSPRGSKPFIALNCAALPRDLVESELFGYEGGAFTGAKKVGNIGKFELANEGTLLLDEIGELPIEVQPKLLRVIENGSVIRIGGNSEKQINVRVIAATNRDLKEEAASGNFRKDLYYRLNVMEVRIPPLSERVNDIALLAKHFVHKLNTEYHREISEFSGEALECLKSFKWEGNVRQLQNVITRAYYLSDGPEITLSDLPEEIRKGTAAAQRVDNISPLKSEEKKFLRNLLIEYDGNVAAVAEKLNLSKPTVYRKIKKLGIGLHNLSGE